MSRKHKSSAGKAVCLALVLLLAGMMVLYGSPGQRRASAFKGKWIAIPGLVELIGACIEIPLAGWKLYRENKANTIPDYDEKMAHIGDLINEINLELGDIEDALQSVVYLIQQIENSQQNWSLRDVLGKIDGTWSNYQYSIQHQDFSNIDRWAENDIMGEYEYETYIRDIYNYISHKNQPRSALDKYVDLLIGPSATVGATQDFSTTVATTDGSKVVVERPTYFDYKGWTGGHDVMGARGRSKVYYFAEGTCRPGFDTYFCLQNPDNRDAGVRLTYMTGDGQTKVQQILVPALSRATVSPVDILRPAGAVADWPGVDFSTRVESTNGVGIIAERPMYFNYQGNWSGGHTVVGTTAPAGKAFFAEGTCRPGFDSYLCVQNPGAAATRVKATFMTGDGGRKEREFDMPAHSRYTLRAEEVLGRGDGPGSDFSATVESTDGGLIVAERPVYFDYRGWTGGHDVMGAAAPGKEFYFAEGTCRPGFDPYICLQNPGNAAAKASLTYMRGDGTTAGQVIEIPAHSRATVSPRDILGTGEDAAHDFSTKVVCTEGDGIIAERPMYFDYKGNWTGGHNVMGAPAAASDWYFAEGTIREGFIPYYCIQNPGPAASKVKITFMGTDGRAWGKNLTVPAHSRMTVAATDAATPLMDNYGGMEEYFTELVVGQAKALQLVMEAKQYNPGRYGSAQAYAVNTFKPMLLDNAERLVMAQATTVNDPTNNTISLGTEGRDVLARANFFAQMLTGKALQQDTSNLTGTMISTYEQGAVPSAATLDLKAYNKTTGKIEAPSKVEQVPLYAPNMAEPYNATNWKGPGLVDKYYDWWDPANQSVSFSNTLCVVRYEFTNASPGYYYDIKDGTGATVAANVPVAKYTDDYAQADTGDNTFGYFAVTRRANGGARVMMSNWTYKITNTGTGSDKGDDFDVSTLTPKHVSSKMSLHEDHDVDFELYGGRTFTYAGPDQAIVKIGATYTTTGKFNTDDARVGDYGKAHYQFVIYDITDSADGVPAGDAFEPHDWSFSDKTGDGDHKFSDSSADYIATGQMPIGSYKLTTGRKYQVRVYNWLKCNAIGVMTHVKAYIDLSLVNVYLQF
jgi:hypothetical protein